MSTVNKIIDSSSFVPIKLQENLVRLGWRLRHSSFSTKETNRKVYSDGKRGLQSWELFTDYDGYYLLDIMYTTDKKEKNVTLWVTGDQTEEFRSRNIISVLKRRVLYKRGAFKDEDSSK